MAIHLSLVFIVGVHSLVKVSLLDMARLFTHGPMKCFISCEFILVQLKRDSKWIRPIKGDFCLASLVALQYPMNVLIRFLHETNFCKLKSTINQ